MFYNAYSNIIIIKTNQKPVLMIQIHNNDI